MSRPVGTSERPLLRAYFADPVVRRRRRVLRRAGCALIAYTTRFCVHFACELRVWLRALLRTGVPKWAFRFYFFPRTPTILFFSIFLARAGIFVQTLPCRRPLCVRVWLLVCVQEQTTCRQHTNLTLQMPEASRSIWVTPPWWRWRQARLMTPTTTTTATGMACPLSTPAISCRCCSDCESCLARTLTVPLVSAVVCAACASLGGSVGGVAVCYHDVRIFKSTGVFLSQP
jgi:hypothetical protein